MKAMDPFSSYLRLVDKVESFLSAIRSKYGNFIKCRPGCFRCCLVDMTIFRVESENLRKGYELLGPAQRKLLNRKARHWHSLRKKGEIEECPLLIDDKCALYAHRPIICRTHGYPLYSPLIVKDEGQVSACKLNFAGFELNGVDPAFAINLNLLDATLASINYIFMKGQGLSRQFHARSSMVEILL